MFTIILPVQYYNNKQRNGIPFFTSENHVSFFFNSAGVLITSAEPSIDSAIFSHSFVFFACRPLTALWGQRTEAAVQLQFTFLNKLYKQLQFAVQ